MPAWFLSFAAVASLLLTGCSKKDEATPTAPAAAVPDKPVWTKDIAPIVFIQCVICHREGEAAPFSLLTYQDAKKRAKDIVENTASRNMPPWLPVAGHGSFEDERRLTDVQIGTIKKWAETGAPEGDAKDQPPAPQFKPGWQIGEPDLVVTLSEPFILPAEGKDVYRNFVIPIPSQARLVAGMELSPGSAVKVIHHAFMLIDTTRESRRRDEEEPGPGFAGMDPGTTAQSPQGHFISWQPGKIARRYAPGFAWRLNEGTDLVLQLHMKPSGKPETVQPRIGFYFTDQPALHYPVKLVLTTNDINIPAGETAWSFEKRYTLPVDVKVTGVIPHAHYLGKQLHSWAELPDGKKEWLMRIDDWNFNWQGDYRYAPPVALPKGSVLVQKFTYDNSAANPRNPNNPPKPVSRGLQTTDEMGELWLQLLPGSSADAAVLTRDMVKWVATNRSAELEKKTTAGTATVHELVELAKAMLPTGRTSEAEARLREALLRDRQNVEAHYYLGFILSQTQRIPAAKESLQRALEINPAHPQSLNGLGMIFMGERNFTAATDCFRRAAAADPQNITPLLNLARACLSLGNRDEARAALHRANDLKPGDPQVRDLMQKAGQ